MGKPADTVDPSEKDMSKMEGKYLTFALDQENYGIGIMKIKEIIGMMPVTSVPQTPDFMKGVINLRGKVFPVIDLRLKFGMAAADWTDRTCIIVVEVDVETGPDMIGIVVDSVSDVMSIKGEDIETGLTFGKNLDTNYIFGMAKTDGGVKILIDIDKVLSTNEVTMLNKIV